MDEELLHFSASHANGGESTGPKGKRCCDHIFSFATCGFFCSAIHVTYLALFGILIIDISSEFNGIQRTFTLQRQGDVGVEPLSIEKGNYGVIDLAANLLVVIDGVLQTPGIDYSFNGGTQITFSEAPKSDYSCQIFFYKGSQNDTSFIDVDPPLEIGDKLELSIASTNSSC